MNNSHNNGDISQNMTNSSSYYNNKKNYDELKLLLEDKYKKFEERLRHAVTIGE